MRNGVFLLSMVLAACAAVEDQTDTGVFDTGIDLPSDTIADSALDPGPDTDLDPVPDTWFDTGVDTGIDTGVDTGIDTGFDTGVDTGFDTGTDPGTDGGGGWGSPYCGSGTTISDRGSYTDSVVIPDMGIFRVMQLDITFDDRRFLGIGLPWDDLVVSLTSGTGVERTFWYEFQGDYIGPFTGYSLPVTWLIPAWWETDVGGTWTIDIDDTTLSFTSTTLVSWCITPLDPALHAGTVIDATLDAVASATGSIPDCDPSGTCPGRKTVEMQVDDLVRAYGTPTLNLSVSHSDPSQVRIVFTGANGWQTTIWDRTSGTIPTSVSLTGMTDTWMTGRYQLVVEDHDEYTTGSIASWSVHAN